MPTFKRHELFPDLQERYPIAGRVDGEEPVYRLLEHLTEQDIAFNLERLRLEVSSRLRHADSLEAWSRSRAEAE